MIVSRSSFDASKPLPGSGDLEIAFDSGPFDPPANLLAASPPATPATAAPPARSGVLAFDAAVAMLPPADFAPATTESLAEARPLAGDEVELAGRARDFAAVFGFARALLRVEDFAFVELLAFAERFFVAAFFVDPPPAEPAWRLDFAVAAFREGAFGLPAPPEPLADVREAALLALLPFELERFLVAPELERFVL